MKRLFKFAGLLSLVVLPSLVSAQAVELRAGATSSEHGTADRTDYSTALAYNMARVGFHRMEKRTVGSEQELFASFGHTFMRENRLSVFGSLAIDSDGRDTTTSVLPEFTLGAELGSLRSITNSVGVLGKFERFDRDIDQWTGGLRFDHTTVKGVVVGAFGTLSNIDGLKRLEDSSRPYMVGLRAGNKVGSPVTVSGYAKTGDELLDYPKVVTRTKEVGFNSVIRLAYSPVSVMLGGAVGSRFSSRESYNKLQAGLRIGF